MQAWTRTSKERSNSGGCQFNGLGVNCFLIVSISYYKVNTGAVIIRLGFWAAKLDIYIYIYMYVNIYAPIIRV